MPQTAFLIWGFFETLLHLGIARTSSALRSKKRCSHPVATSTFATLLKVSIFDTIEKSVCYYTRAINFKQLLIPCENFCVNLQHKNKLLTTKTNEQKEEIKIYKLTT